jgi:hypothetical protein
MSRLTWALPASPSLGTRPVPKGSDLCAAAPIVGDVARLGAGSGRELVHEQRPTVGVLAASGCFTTTRIISGSTEDTSEGLAASFDRAEPLHLPEPGRGERN